MYSDVEFSKWVLGFDPQLSVRDKVHGYIEFYYLIICALILACLARIITSVVRSEPIRNKWFVREYSHWLLRRGFVFNQEEFKIIREHKY